MNKFEYQLDVLKMEIETVNASIRQMDKMGESIKNWAILIWAAATGATITQDKLNAYIALTAIIPLAFWLVDTWYRRIQRKFIWRSIQISKFLNDDRLVKSFQEQRMVDFDLFDPKSRLDKSKKYEGFVSWRRVMMFRSLSLLYLSLAGMSILAWIIKLLTNKPA